MSSNIQYENTISHLNSGLLSVQEKVNNLATEQRKTADLITLVHQELAAFKENHTKKLDELLFHIDGDFKRVSQEIKDSIAKSDEKFCDNEKKFATKNEVLTLLNIDSIEVRQPTTETVQRKTACESCETVVSSVANFSLDFEERLTSIGEEMQIKLNNNDIDTSKIEEACLDKVETYIRNHVLHEISTEFANEMSTVNSKFLSLKMDLLNSLEQNKIELEKLGVNLVTIKKKVADLQNPKRCFDDTEELHSCSVDAVTPFRLKQLYPGTSPMRTPRTPLDSIYMNETEQSGLCSTPHHQDNNNGPSVCSGLAGLSCNKRPQSEQANLYPEHEPDRLTRSLDLETAGGPESQYTWLNSIFIGLTSLLDV